MSRNKVDACIFCSNAPCTCNQPAKKAAAKPPKPQVKKEPEASASPAKTKPSHLDAMRAAAAAAPARPAIQVEPEKKFDPFAGMSEDDIVWNAAIRNLAPLMRESDRERYTGIITSKPHPDEAKIMWKRRRRDAEEAG